MKWYQTRTDFLGAEYRKSIFSICVDVWVGGHLPRKLNQNFSIPRISTIYWISSNIFEIKNRSWKKVLSISNPGIQPTHDPTLYFRYAKVGWGKWISWWIWNTLDRSETRKVIQFDSQDMVSVLILNYLATNNH